MRLKKDPSAVNMSVLLKEVTRPMADNEPNQALCSRNDDAPAGTQQTVPIRQIRPVKHTEFACGSPRPEGFMMLLSMEKDPTPQSPRPLNLKPPNHYEKQPHPTRREGIRQCCQQSCHDEPHKVASHEGLVGAVGAGPPAAPAAVK